MSKYLELAMRIDADIEYEYWRLCMKLRESYSNYINLTIDPLLILFKPKTRQFPYKGCSAWFYSTKEGNQHRIIALLFMDCMYQDEQKSKRK